MDTSSQSYSMQLGTSSMGQSSQNCYEGEINLAILVMRELLRVPVMSSKHGNFPDSLFKPGYQSCRKS